MRYVLVFCLTVGAAEAQSATATTKARQPAEVKIPATAVKTEDGNYHYTDAKGKKWIFRNTPFGVARSEDKEIPATATPFGTAKPQEKAPEPAAPAAADKNPTVAYDQGDTVRFERPTPFGVSKYTKKKSELTDSEKAILREQMSKQQ